MRFLKFMSDCVPEHLGQLAVASWSRGVFLGDLSRVSGGGPGGVPGGSRGGSGGVRGRSRGLPGGSQGVVGRFWKGFGDFLWVLESL